jgi:Cu/Ag efflux protein CusF
MRPLLMTFTFALACLAFAGCKQGDVEKEKIYDIKGKVVSVDVAKKSVKLDHEDIPGFMKAMEMSFEVESAKMLDGLKAGDQVQGKLKVKAGSNVITELRSR